MLQLHMVPSSLPAAGFHAQCVLSLIIDKDVKSPPRGLKFKKEVTVLNCITVQSCLLSALVGGHYKKKKNIAQTP